ncbi:RNA polymerase sigma factor [Candidatus Parcubacteria bacterium]|jgi:RNA polymerase sigma-70 factor, ECF subfamily|nr:RNA polymerase sigma factor [Candidatus Parcubacteria bacterium]MBT3948513.1 RNA polymerase sigma factor [Candidatus Parcubacteria bacterium]
MTAEERKNEYVSLYNEYTDQIFRYFYFRVYERERALELSQEAFIRLWKYVASGKEIEHLKALLYKISHNLAIDESRKKKAYSLDNLMQDGFEIPTNLKDERNDKLDVMAILQEVEGIGERYKEVILLRYVEGMMVKDIAVILEESENVISVRLHRGIKQLSEKFKE